MGGEGDPLGMCDKLKFGRSTKWHMHKSDLVLEKKIPNIIRGFNIKTNLIQEDLTKWKLTNKKQKKKKVKLPYYGLCCSSWQLNRNQRKLIETSTWTLPKNWEICGIYGAYSDTKCILCTWNGCLKLGKRVGKKKKSDDD